MLALWTHSDWPGAAMSYKCHAEICRKLLIFRCFLIFSQIWVFCGEKTPALGFLQDI